MDFWCEAEALAGRPECGAERGILAAGWRKPGRNVWSLGAQTPATGQGDGMNALRDLLAYSGNDLHSRFRPFAERMEEAGQHPMVLNVFKSLYARLLDGDPGSLAESDITPLAGDELARYGSLDGYTRHGMDHLGKVAIIKLNGGLGTSMGLEKAKSLIPVRDGMSFLQLTLAQVDALRTRYNVPVPLLFMDSFRTHQDTLTATRDCNNGSCGIPLTFVQNKFPKVLAETLEPADCPENRSLEWNPPGHGDIYTALITSHILPQLLDSGIRYAFVSNVDNLGALFDPSLLGYMVKEGLPFVMEVARRQETDRKGGHLARLKDGRLALREIAQCPEADRQAFQDISRHSYFNTNSIWLDLAAVRQVILEEGMVPLSLIRNEKTLDPRDASSPRVIQLETAMGAAISCFADAAAVEVPRRRFSPVKTTADLLTVMSDCYELRDDYALVPREERSEDLPQVSLDGDYYKCIDDFLCRFPEGVPSMMDCSSLDVCGDVTFAADVALEGDVRINAEGAASVFR
jgi:UTP--glucose-1-phosphate uridylyltransferase